MAEHQDQVDAMNAEFHALLAKIEQERTNPELTCVMLCESEMQTVLLALAELAFRRPGWEPACIRPIVARFGHKGVEMFEDYLTPLKTGSWKKHLKPDDGEEDEPECSGCGADTVPLVNGLCADCSKNQQAKNSP